MEWKIYMGQDHVGCHTVKKMGWKIYMGQDHVAAC